jgi:DNA-binding GntR family transcriptional regulator
MVSTRQMANFELSDFFIVQSCGFKAHLGEVTDEHGAIIAALKQRDAMLSQEVAMQHIDSIAKQVVAAMSVMENHGQSS